jgi:peptidyl-prolyl cis-trans isomerase SurA
LTPVAVTLTPKQGVLAGVGRDIAIVLKRMVCGLILLVIAAAPAAAQNVSIAAVVNSGVVTTDDLSSRITLVLRSSGIADTPENRQRLAPRVLRTLIDEQLELQEAKRLKITVAKADLDKALTRIAKQNGLPLSGLDAYLVKLGIPRQALVDQLSASIAWNKVIESQVMPEVIISDQEVADAMKRMAENSKVPLNQVSEIFLAVDNPTQDAEVKRLADRLEDELHGGGNFASIAQQFSQSPTAAEGGSLGWITPSEIDPDLASALATMKPGEVSPPIHAGGGYYILALLDRRLPGQGDPNDAVISVVEAGAPIPANAPADFRAKLAQALHQLIASAKSCPIFAANARKIGLPFVKEAPDVKAISLSAGVRQIALGLAVGEVSKPFAVQGGVGLMMMCARKDPPATKPPTIEQVRDALGRQRLDVLARRYLRDLRRNAYVDIRG